jgi:Raf kinase inhibitor-like YbhB/YbcL family protein
MRCLKFFFPLIVLSLASCSSGCNNTNIKATNGDVLPKVEPFKLSSPAFHEGDNIPMLYTCDSTNISPALHWNKPYNNTASFALIMDDPDAPMGTWVHWVVYNIPATDTSLPMHFPMDSTLSNGIKQGYTSFRTTGYGGPCPPDGMHRYFFKLYALDAKLNLPAGLTKTQLLNAMKGHILAEADLMGRYIKKKSDQ